MLRAEEAWKDQGQHTEQPWTHPEEVMHLQDPEMRSRRPSKAKGGDCWRGRLLCQVHLSSSLGSPASALTGQGGSVSTRLRAKPRLHLEDGLGGCAEGQRVDTPAWHSCKGLFPGPGSPRISDRVLPPMQVL